MIRAIQKADIASVAKIYNYYIEHTIVSYEESILGKAGMAERVQKVLEDGFPWLVAEIDGIIGGYSYGYRWNTRSAYRHSAEVTVYLLPDYYRKGIGTQLYKALFTLLKAQGIRMVIGGIGLPNPASVALHEKMGMKKVAHFEKVGHKFNQWLDVGYWQGDLELL